MRQGNQKLTYYHSRASSPEIANRKTRRWPKIERDGRNKQLHIATKKGGLGGARKAPCSGRFEPTHRLKFSSSLSTFSYMTVLREASETCSVICTLLFDKPPPAHCSRLPARSAAGQKKYIPTEDIFFLCYRSRYENVLIQAQNSPNMFAHRCPVRYFPAVFSPFAFHSTRLRAVGHLGKPEVSLTSTP